LGFLVDLRLVNTSCCGDFAQALSLGAQAAAAEVVVEEKEATAVAAAAAAAAASALTPETSTSSGSPAVTLSSSPSSSKRATTTTARIGGRAKGAHQALAARIAKGLPATTSVAAAATGGGGAAVPRLEWLNLSGSAGLFNATTAKSDIRKVVTRGLVVFGPP
jgi:hypothetical protein